MKKPTFPKPSNTDFTLMPGTPQINNSVRATDTSIPGGYI